MMDLIEPVSVRAMLAAIACCVAGLLTGGRAIAWLARRYREPIKSISPTVERLHRHKSATPTMGGLFIAIGVFLTACGFANLAEPRIWIGLLALGGFAAIGAIDDLIKLRTSRRGISAIEKLTCQFVIAGLVATSALYLGVVSGSVSAVLLMFAMIVGANAVNVTDGLDGLAAGCGWLTSAALSIVLLATDASELAIITAAMTGALLAFLRFNRYPARVFMGDTGSQAIGATLALCGVLSGHWIVTAILGGVFLLEAASVAIQLASYRIRGRRLFLCAPLHHHFQFAGYGEPAIVRGFVALAALSAILGVSAWKLENTGEINTNNSTANISTASSVSSVSSVRNKF